MKRFGWIALSILLAVVTVGSIVRVPPVRGLSAVPAYARLVYHDRDSSGFLSVFPSLGTADGDFAGVWDRYFQAVGSRPLAVATAPFAGPAHRDCWVAVSELDGAAALALRWRLMLFPPDGIRHVRSYAVWPVWALEDPSLPSWAKVRFSVTENLLICAISSDSRDIDRLLDVADGRAPSKVR